MEIKTKKVEDGLHLAYIKETNDPVAVIHKTAGTHPYVISWHPSFKQLHPKTNSLKYMNFSEEKSMSSATDSVQYQTEQLMSDTSKHGTSLRTEIGEPETKMVSGKYDKEPKPLSYTNIHVFHPETDEKIATYSLPSYFIPKIGTSSGLAYDYGHFPTNVKFHGEQPSDEDWAVANRKFPGLTPLNVVDKIHYWLHNKGREPRFIGKSISNEHKVYTHKMTSENASSEFEKHLKEHPEYSKYTFVRHSPTLFVAHKPSAGKYYSALTKFVDSSKPGELTIFSVKQYDSADTGNNLKEVIE